MAKTKISALTTLADGSIAIGDLIPIVDIDDTSQAASGTTKKVTITSLASAVATAFSGDSPTFVNLNTTGTTTLGDSGDATTVNGTLGVTGATTLTGAITATSQTLAIGAITSGLINGQTISSAANFTGTLAVADNIMVAGATARGFEKEIGIYSSNNVSLGLSNAGQQSDIIVGGGTYSFQFYDRTAAIYPLTFARTSGAATFSSSVTATSYITSSDERLKNNIILADLNKCYENIKNLPLKRYTWNDNCLTTEQAKDRNKLGWIAQDVQKVFSKSVFANKFEKVKQEDGFELVEEDVFIETEKEIENKEIKFIDGKYVETIIKSIQKNKEQQFDEFDLLDEKGEVIGKHKVAKKQKVEKIKFKQDVIEDCLSLNADQIYAAMYGAVQLLIQKVEALEAK